MEDYRITRGRYSVNAQRVLSTEGPEGLRQRIASLSAWADEHAQNASLVSTADGKRSLLQRARACNERAKAYQAALSVAHG